MSEEAYKKHWDRVRDLAAANQDGDGGYPSQKVLEIMSSNLAISPLQIGDEHHGYFIWLKPQTASIVTAMRTLKTALSEFDDEVGLRLAAEARVKMLEQRFAEMASAEPQLAPKPKCPAPQERSEAKLSTTNPDLLSIYERNRDGESWKELGGNSILVKVKRFALKQGLSWPPNRG